MNKKFNTILIILFLTVSLMTGSAWAKKAQSLAGLYHGSAPGYHGEVKVTVELDDQGKILSLVVDKGHHETKGVGTVAIKKISQAIVNQQALHVDTVTGATLTGNGVIAATANALESAGVDPTSLGYVEIVAEPEEKVAFDPEAMPKKSPKTGSITVKDAKGRKVKIDLPISSYAISTMDVIDYIIPLLGQDAFNKLVAGGQSGSGGVQKYSRLYTPIVGNYRAHFGQISEHNAPFDLEMVLSMNPDVIIVNSAMAAHKHIKAIEPQLKEVGIPVVMIDVPGKSNATSAQETIKLLGRIFQKEERATEVVDFIDKQFDLILSKNLDQRTDKPTVYYEKSGYSEVFGSTQASVRNGWGSLIALAGGDNIADTLLLNTPAAKGGSGTLDPEYVIQADPDFIILSGSGAGWMDNFPNNPAQKPSFDIVNRTGWRDLKAVKSHNVYELAHAMNRTIYSFYACLKMASLFYPDEFSDVDPDAIMDEFFKRFMLVDSTMTGWYYRYGQENAQ